MQRIVDGILYEGNRASDCWEVRTWEQNGVMERSVRPVVEWVEVGPVPPLRELDPVKDADYIEEKRLESLRKAAQRAKKMCRQVIIAEAFDELLTLTYRKLQPDRDLCKKHFEKWYRRMKKALGGFRFCASFEVQKRGSMHVHVATHKLPQHALYKGVKIKAFELGTRIWRDIVGADNGLCYVGAGPSKFGHKRRRNMSLAKMASYVSKYITKDYAEAPEESNRYSRSNGTVIAPVHVMRLRCSFLEAVAVTFEQGDGDVIVSHRVGRFADSVWLCTECPKARDS